MTRPRSRFVLALSLSMSLLTTAGCASSTDDEAASSDDALMEQPSQDAPDGKTPIVFEVKPETPQLKLNLEQDWSKAQIDVMYPVDSPKWIKADKDGSPSFVSEIRDQVQNGVGSGNCRVKVGLKKFVVGCRWQF